MVTVSDYAVRTNSEGEEFVALILQGDLEMVQSKETGRFYATVKVCSVTSTFTEETASQLIGKQIPGRIIREKCDPYEYVIPESGEVIELTHSWVYSPEEWVPTTTQPVVQHRNIQVQPEAKFSENGVMSLEEA